MGGPEEHEGVSPTRRGPPIPSWPTPRAYHGVKALAGRAFQDQTLEEGIPGTSHPHFPRGPHLPRLYDLFLIEIPTPLLHLLLLGELFCYLLCIKLFTKRMHVLSRFNC
jgi:hypothetical protein